MPTGNGIAGTKSARAIWRIPSPSPIVADQRNCALADVGSPGFCIWDFARVRSFFVIARNSSFAYKGRTPDVRKVLEGSVRRSADRLRVTARLVDAETGNHLWADRYDRPLRDLFDLQDEIAAAATNAIKPAVADAELRRALRKPPESIGAWETYQRGLWRLLNYKMDDLPPARELLTRATEMDHTLAAAHAALAWLCNVESGVFGLLPFEDGFRLGAEHARMAIGADPNDSDGHAAMAYLLFFGGDFKAASEHAEQALTISPSCAGAYFANGARLLFDKQPVKARENLRIALQLDPRGIISTLTIRGQIAISYYFEGNYEAAVDLLRGVITDTPTHPLAHRWLAAALGQLGRTDEARSALATAMTGWPDSFQRYTQRCPPWFRADDFEHMLDGLRKAGWHGASA